MNYREITLAEDSLISEAPLSDTGICVVIPCFSEPTLLRSIQSLKDCLPAVNPVEVIVVINHSEDSTDEIKAFNRNSYEACLKWNKQNDNPKLRFYFLLISLPARDAGVGLARKLGMDEAARRFFTIGNPGGVIVCFDADSTVDSNYLLSVETHFAKHKSSPACSIYFEHPLDGGEESEQIYEGIVQYELYLRYYRSGLEYSGFPFPFHTIGSSMAVRANAYLKQNGMNKRKAGEDFYFLQKMFLLGNFTQINDTRVIPSPRISDRVPFGTGRAMMNWTQTEQKYVKACVPQTFSDLRLLFSSVPKLYKSNEGILEHIITSMPLALQEFLETNHFKAKCAELNSNSKDESSFSKRFYEWFNAFMILRYSHYARDQHYGTVPVSEAAFELGKLMEVDFPLVAEKATARELLNHYRKQERGF